MPQLTDYEMNAINKLGETIHKGKWSNDGLVELIKLSGDYLNLKTVPDYCKDNDISYTGAVKQSKKRSSIILFNTKFILDNI